MSEIMEKKAKQAALCYEDLTDKLDIHPSAQVLFNVSEDRQDFRLSDCT